MNTSVPAVTRPGLVSGKMIFVKRWRKVHPSIVALSSSSLGIVDMNPWIRKIDTGRLMAVYVSMRAPRVSYSLRKLLIFMIGTISAMMGIRTPERRNVRIRLLPLNFSLDRAKADMAATTRFSAVVAMATMIECRNILGRLLIVSAFLKFTNCHTSGSENGLLRLNSWLVLKAEMMSHTSGRTMNMRKKIRKNHLKTLAMIPGTVSLFCAIMLHLLSSPSLLFPC